MKCAILIGASGSGKTTIAREVEKRFEKDISVFYFDRIGVPSIDQMIADYGSGEAWQRAKTIEWIATIAPVCATGRSVLLEGQTRLSFLAEAAQAAGAFSYTPILVDCDDEIRAWRLTQERCQPELISDDMKRWAEYLRYEARKSGCDILDTSELSLELSVEYVMDRLIQNSSS